MINQELTEEQRNVIGKVEKLLKLAGRNTNEAEAAAATQKVMELLAAYNLDLGTVEREGGGDARREDAKMRGGAYEWQRGLWRAVAELNFCLYFPTKQWARKEGGKGKLRLRNFHRVVGRKVNVVSTRVMLDYLEGAIERLVKERFPGNARDYWGQDIMAYREGIADRVASKIYDRRQEFLREERRKEQEAAEAAIREGRAGVSTERALTLATFAEAEHDANMDFIYGEGWSAKQRAKRAERAEALRRAEEAAAKWAAENPELAAKLEAERLAEEKKASKRRTTYRYRQTARDKRAGSGYYYEGYDDGAAISIDPQVDAGGLKRIAQK